MATRSKRPVTRKKALANKKVSRSKIKQYTPFMRFLVIVIFFSFWFLLVSARLVHLQVTQHEWLSERAEGQRLDIKRTKQLRGTIFDRDQRPLAMSVKVKTLYANPSEISDIDAAAKAVSKATKLDQGQIARQLRDAAADNKKYVALAKRLDDDTVEKINKSLEVNGLKKADAPYYAGLHWSDDQRRSYPYKTMAAPVIGFSDINDDGKAGVELSNDEILRGKVIKSVRERDRLGRVYEETGDEREKPGDIVLTLSASMQYKTEQALADGVRAANARSGMAVALDPKTGDVLAMANYPSFDPNAITADQANNISNKITQTVYSPGSVFKLLTYGAALEKNLFQVDDTIDAGNGTINVAGHVFRDSHHVGSVTYAQALAESSNVCAIKTGLSVGRQDFYSIVQKMGFGARTGIDLPAETAGIVRSPDKWNGDSLASMSIGYEIGVTALQMANAFATIANEGIRNQPRIIKEVRKPDEPVFQPQNGEPVRVVSPETAAKLRQMLRQVVLTGTGKRAQLDGYTSAGKTGTAWKFDPATKKIDPSKYISSFIGMAPADSPKVVIAVIVDEPKGAARDGGGVAAPIFKSIAEDLLPELGIQKDANSKAAPVKELKAKPLVSEAPEPNVKGEAVEAETPKLDTLSNVRSAGKKDDKAAQGKGDTKNTKPTAKPTNSPTGGKNPAGNLTAEDIESRKRYIEAAAVT